MGALALLAERTEGYSGSDLHDLCALAAQQPIHRFIEREESCAQTLLCALVHVPGTVMCYMRLVQGKRYRPSAHALGQTPAWRQPCSLLCSGTMMARHRPPAVRCRRPLAWQILRPR